MAYQELRVNYSLDRVIGREPDEDQLDQWWVRLDRWTYHSMDDMENDAGECASLATAHLYGLDPLRNLAVGQQPFDVADAHSADVAYYFQAIFDARGEPRSDTEDAFEAPVGEVLVLDDVRVPEHLRRRGYGSFLVAEALLTLAKHGIAVFAHPGPTDVGPGTDVERTRAEIMNTRFLGALGFEPFRDRMWSLDLSLAEPGQKLAEIRRGGFRE